MVVVGKRQLFGDSNYGVFGIELACHNFYALRPQCLDQSFVAGHLRAIPVSVGRKIKDSHNLVAFGDKTSRKCRVIEPFVLVVLALIIERVIETKAIYQEENTIHLHSGCKKNPDPRGSGDP